MPLEGRVAHVQLEHESVDLRFGKRIRSLLLDRVLRRQYEEGLLQDVRRAADRHLLFLHCLEQSGLHFGRRAIDLVSQNDVGEDRTFLHRKSSVRLIVDLRADDVGGQQIRGELNAAERRVYRLCQGPNRQSLGETGHAFEQDVAAGQQAYQQALDHVILADNPPSYLVDNLLNDGCISGCNGLCAHVSFLS